MFSTLASVISTHTAPNGVVTTLGLRKDGQHEVRTNKRIVFKGPEDGARQDYRILTGTYSLGDPADRETLAEAGYTEADHKAEVKPVPALLRRNHSRCLHDRTPKARAACRKLAKVFVADVPAEHTPHPVTTVDEALAQRDLDRESFLQGLHDTKNNRRRSRR